MGEKNQLPRSLPKIQMKPAFSGLQKLLGCSKYLQNVESVFQVDLLVQLTLMSSHPPGRLLWPRSLLPVAGWEGTGLCFQITEPKIRASNRLPRFHSGKESTSQRRGCKKSGSIPRWGRSHGVGNGNPLQHSFLENSMDTGAWRATMHGVTKSWTWLNTRTQQPFAWLHPLLRHYECFWDNFSCLPIGFDLSHSNSSWHSASPQSPSVGLN